jgi:hypothetical protein
MFEIRALFAKGWLVQHNIVKGKPFEAVSEVALVSRQAVIFEHRSGAAYWP